MCSKMGAWHDKIAVYTQADVAEIIGNPRSLRHFFNMMKYLSTRRSVYLQPVYGSVYFHFNTHMNKVSPWVNLLK